MSRFRVFLRSYLVLNAGVLAFVSFICLQNSVLEFTLSSVAGIIFISLLLNFVPSTVVAAFLTIWED